MAWNCLAPHYCICKVYFTLLNRNSSTLYSVKCVELSLWFWDLCQLVARVCWTMREGLIVRWCRRASVYSTDCPPRSSLAPKRRFPCLRRASFQVSVCTVCQILPSGQKFWHSSVYSRDSPTVSIQVVSLEFWLQLLRKIWIKRHKQVFDRTWSGHFQFKIQFEEEKDRAFPEEKFAWFVKPAACLFQPPLLLYCIHKSLLKRGSNGRVVNIHKFMP